jgi:hypothetical protein
LLRGGYYRGVGTTTQTGTIAHIDQVEHAANVRNWLLLSPQPRVLGIATNYQQPCGWRGEGADILAKIKRSAASLALSESSWVFGWHLQIRTPEYLGT